MDSLIEKIYELYQNQAENSSASVSFFKKLTLEDMKNKFRDASAEELERTIKVLLKKEKK